MPDCPIVDTHVLLSNPERFEMPTMGTGYWDDPNDRLGRRQGLAEYDADTEGLPIEAMVVMEVGVAPPVALLEAQWAAAIAKQEPRIQAIVAWAPVAYGERVAAYLEAVKIVDPRVTGVRQGLELEPDDFAIRPGFVRGVQLVARYGLSFEIAAKQHQLASVIELVRRCPETVFMLDHIGKPRFRNSSWRAWSDAIAELAGFPNICCKVSGVITEADHNAWTLDDIAPSIERVFEVFGEDRVVFGGDWPFVFLAGSYHRWVDSLDAITSGLTTGAKRKFWAENARQFYRSSTR